MIDVDIRQLNFEDMERALGLVWEVFARHQAADYTNEGVDEFWASIDPEFMGVKMGEGELRFWGAFSGEDIVGVVSMRGLTRLEHLYIATDFQKKGIATRLIKRAIFDSKLHEDDLKRISVTAPPCAYAFFEKIGFVREGDEEQSCGQVGTPYVLIGEKND